MKKLYLAFAALALVSGCTNWVERHVPTTDAERAAVREMTEKLMAEVPDTLSGFDQDWDDAIRSAGDVAMRTCCQATWWEFDSGFPGGFTGRWKYGEQITKTPCP